MKKYAYLSILAFTMFGFQVQAANTLSVDTGRDLYSACESLDSDLDEETLHAVLTQAAPHFGFLPDQFIRLYHRCNCVAVDEIGLNTYRVEYGGLGIEILVDVSATLEVDKGLEFFTPKYFERD